MNEQAKQYLNTREASEQKTSNIEQLIETALDIAERRAEILGRLRAELLSGDDYNALKLAREYCGIENEESHRTDSRIN